MPLVTASPLESPWSHGLRLAPVEWRRLFSEFLGTFLLVLAAPAGRWSTPASGGPDRPGRGRHRAGTAGHGHDLVHGRGVGGAPESRGHARRSRCAATSRGAGSRATSSSSWSPRPLAVLVLSARPRGRRRAGRDAARQRLHRPPRRSRWSSLLTVRPGQHHPGHGVDGAERRPAVGAWPSAGTSSSPDLWSSPVSGASMNPARSFGPALVTGGLQLVLGLPGRPVGRCAGGGRRGDAPPGARRGRGWPRRRARRTGRLHGGREGAGTSEPVRSPGGTPVRDRWRRPARSSARRGPAAGSPGPG